MTPSYAPETGHYTKGHIRYLWRCTAQGCNAYHKIVKEFRPSLQLWNPSLAEGWHVLPDGRILCPKHQVLTIIDGEVIK